MKIGRNEKCWCNSGKKFKHCHYGRESEQAITKGELIGQSKNIRSRKCCYVPKALQHECDRRIVNAHTVSKSGSLIEIADSTNHVYGLKINLANIFKNKGKLVPEKIGVNQASTFKGFCSKHDKQLFSCIEDHPFNATEEQCLALMFRSVAKELYAKEGSLLSSEVIKSGDKGKQLADQLSIQKFAADNQLGIKAALRELSDFKDQLDGQLLGNFTNNLSHLIFESSRSMPVAVSSIVSPVSDFNGTIIQDLGDLNVVAEQIVFNSFSSDGKGYVVFSWLTKSAIILGFVNTLIAIDKAGIFGALIRLFFGLAENSFISPEWWDGLPDAQKKKIESLIMSGVNPFKFDPKGLLIDDGVNFSGWNIDNIRKINF
ncbi:SEC-C domain-containing protein [Granulosicoccus antarcticus]|uniref:Protein translocase subunit SecA n=1 Tax=Granulosicoccus antarcticus IMCC3135 TaxID=1192854 RepID=A0A2Z2NNJ3_9GAMM|nr:SEC-C domain-containing protein [Granulosicoccus antarcticus]ASJ72095.1 hypothetical protein IMCC3135_10005 [Granulosicoccus antarcticus IMCC3135]